MKSRFFNYEKQLLPIQRSELLGNLCAVELRASVLIAFSGKSVMGFAVNEEFFDAMADVHVVVWIGKERALATCFGQ